jgi:hypothetical protein
MFGISVKRVADPSNNQPRRQFIRLCRDIVCNYDKIEQALNRYDHQELKRLENIDFNDGRSSLEDFIVRKQSYSLGINPGNKLICLSFHKFENIKHIKQPM